MSRRKSRPKTYNINMSKITTTPTVKIAYFYAKYSHKNI